MESIIDEEKIKRALKSFCYEVNNYYKSGNIESSFNKPVIDLIQSFGCSAHDFSGERSGITGENIDIKLWHDTGDMNTIPPFGAIEVKKVNGKDDRAKKQIIIEAKKYGNVILTDNATWEFYNSESEKMYSGFRLLVEVNNEFKLDESKVDLFIATIRDFIMEKPSNINSSNRLAYYMSEYAKTIKTVVFNILQGDNSKAMYNELFGLYSKIKQELLPDLEIRNFSDMYAQTIVYGLFIARYNDKTIESFTRGEAIENLSKEGHLLKQFFQHIATSDNLHPTLNDSIDKLCELYSLANIKELLNQYGKKDAIVHFYEDFLTYYDIEQKKSFGAYYTPVAVVKYMVKFVDQLLINDFGIEAGLASNNTLSIRVKCDEYTVGSKSRAQTKNEKDIDVPEVAILDPACGTGTFGAEIIKYIKEKYFSNGNEVFYKDWLQSENGLMERLISFEIMMTSYVIAHLKIRKTIMETLGEQELDKKLSSNIILTNTLSEPKILIERNDQASFFDFSGAITEEAEKADKWKCRRPIQVIIGNPPYLAASKNQYDISAYKYETDGKNKLKEKNPKWLNDDYVKFIRFSEQHIQKDGKGVLAFITNNGYLDNPTFRGMRASLLRTFDKIYILNLHGNSIKKETTPDGKKDENVFDIRVGVSILIGVKLSSSEEWAELNYAEIYGNRNNKYALLENGKIDYKRIVPDDKMAMFIPQVEKAIVDEYEKGISIIELFNIYSAGVVTGRDSITIQKTKNEIEKVVHDFSTERTEELRLKYGLGKDTDWTVRGAINDINSGKGRFERIAYRLFEDRWTYYTGKQNGFYCRARSEVMNNLYNNKNENYGLIVTRGDAGDRLYSMTFITDKIVDAHITAAPTIATVIPLWIFNDQTGSFSNINKEYYDKLVYNLNVKPTEIEVFDYCYGILFDTVYRKKFNELLKTDYPRIPIMKEQEEFYKYVKAGERLRKLHLMRIDCRRELQLETSNNNLLIERIKYNNNSIWINKDTYITGISEEAWNYYLCGFQVIDKWLKLHKGEFLTIEYFNHLKKVVGIIEETIKIQNNE